MTLADRYLSADPRERDALLAEHVFGWEQNARGDWYHNGNIVRNNPPNLELTDLLDGCLRRKWTPSMFPEYTGKDQFLWEITIYSKKGEVELGKYYGVNDPLTALAVAMLKCVEAQRDEALREMQQIGQKFVAEKAGDS